ncbi:MAG: LCP family protein [Clostridia bacterium]|nr:LCP family protein [Clostridia bacterium]
MANDIYFNKNKNTASYTNHDGFVEKLEGTPPPSDKAENGKPKKAKKNKTKKKHRVLRKLVAAVLCMIIVISAGIIALSGLIFRNYTPEPLAPNEYVDSSELMSSMGVTNILLMGVDNKNTNKSTRSDSMILLSFDTVHGEVKLTSFMRDMYVYVPGYYNTKLTHACQYGGPQLTVDTIEYNFSIDIDGYVKIGYELLIELVDALGGVTVAEISEVESKALKKEGVSIEPGTDVHLDGNEALQYCRIRKGQSDFQRTERQREVLTELINTAIKTSPTKLISIATSLIEKVDSNISKDEFMSLGFKALRCFTGGVDQLQIPADGTWSNATKNSMAVLVVDFEANKNILDRFIYKDEDVTAK